MHVAQHPIGCTFFEGPAPDDAPQNPQFVCTFTNIEKPDPNGDDDDDDDDTSSSSTRGGGSCVNCDDDDDDDDTPDGQTRGDSDDRDTDTSSSGDSDKPEGIVEGDQVSVTPVGAPNAGAGGATQTSPLPLFALMSIMIGAVLLRVDGKRI